MALPIAHGRGCSLVHTRCDLGTTPRTRVIAYHDNITTSTVSDGARFSDSFDMCIPGRSSCLSILAPRTLIASHRLVHDRLRERVPRVLALTLANSNAQARTSVEDREQLILAVREHGHQPARARGRRRSRSTRILGMRTAASAPPLPIPRPPPTWFLG